MKIPYFYFLLVTLALSTTGLAQEDGHFRTVDPQEISQRTLELKSEPKSGPKSHIAKKWAKTGLGLGVKFFDLDREKFELLAKYRWRTETSFKSGEYLRIDKWKIKGKLKVGDIIKGTGTPMLFDIDGDSDITFIRQFPTRSQALKTLPYYVAHLPINSERALKKLQPGDFISFPTTLTFFLGHQSEGTQGITEHELHLGYFLRGKFLLHFFRMPQDRMRLKIFTLKEKGLGARGRVHMEGYELFKVNLVDRIAKRSIDYELLNFFTERGSGKMLIYDYVFDLKQERARKAYDALISPTMVLNSIKLLSSIFGKGSDLNKQLLSNLDQVDTIAHKDSPLDVSNRAISIVSQIDSNFSMRRWGAKINLLVAGFNRSRTTLANMIGPTQSREHYLYVPSYSKRNKMNLNLGPVRFNSNSYSILAGIFETDEQMEQLRPHALGTISLRRFIRYSARKQRELIKELQYNLPPGEFERIDWQNWSFKNKKQMSKRSNALVDFRFLVNRQGMDIIAGHTRDEFAAKLRRLAKTPVFEDYGPGIKHKQGQMRLTSMLFERFSDHSPLTGPQKAKRMAHLKSRFNFTQYAPLIFRTLLEGHDLQSLTYYYLDIVAPKSNNITYEYGPSKGSNLLWQIKNADEVINNDDFSILKDLERYQEEVYSSTQ